MMSPVSGTARATHGSRSRIIRAPRVRDAPARGEGQRAVFRPFGRGPPAWLPRRPLVSIAPSEVPSPENALGGTHMLRDATTTFDAGSLRARLTGSFVLPSDPDWDHARQAWNLAVDQRPAAV